MTGWLVVVFLRELEVLTETCFELESYAFAFVVLISVFQLGTKEGYLVKQGAIMKAREGFALICVLKRC